LILIKINEIMVNRKMAALSDLQSESKWLGICNPHTKSPPHSPNSVYTFLNITSEKSTLDQR